MSQKIACKKKKTYATNTMPKQKSRGFTLIELVLVLAIAGLIIVIIFVAVSGAQQSRRDYQRKNYLARVAAALETYFGANGKLPDPSDPATVLDFESSYLPLEKDPKTGLTYSAANSNFVLLGLGAPHDDIPEVGTVQVQYGHWCNRYGNGDDPSDPTAGNATNNRYYAALIGLEAAGYFCVDNYNP